LSDLFEQWRRRGYGYASVNDIGRQMEVIEKLDVDKAYMWKTANPFQYYAFNFVCPRIEKEKAYFTIN
jgi:hypothetical protein